MPLKQCVGVHEPEVLPSPKFQLQLPVAEVVLENVTHTGAHPELVCGPAFTGGMGLTTTVVVAVLIQPFTSVPVTV